MTARRLAAATVVALLALTAADAGVDPAMSAFKAGKFHEAAAEFQALVEQSPDYDFGWFMLGHSFLKMGRPADAEAMFRRALQLAPGRVDYYHGLALALRDEGHLEKAIQVLDAAEPLARDKRPIFALHALRGYLHVKKGAWSAAIVDLAKAQRIQSDPDLLEMLAQAYVGALNLDKAVSLLRGLLGAHPARPETTRLLAETLLMQGQTTEDSGRKKALYTEALVRAERLVELRPDAPEALYLLGRAALGAGRIEMAESAFERVLERDPRQCYVMINLARVRMAREAWASAEGVLRKAAACAPRLGAVYETFGAAYMQQERWEEAAGAFRRANQVQPTPYARAGFAEAMRRLEGDVRPARGPEPDGR